MQVICDNCDEIYFNRILTLMPQSNILKYKMASIYIWKVIGSIYEYLS